MKSENFRDYCVRARPLRVVAYSSGDAQVLDCAAKSVGVHRRCFHGCCQDDSAEAAARLREIVLVERFMRWASSVEGHVRSIFIKFELEPTEEDHRRVLAVLAY